MLFPVIGDAVQNAFEATQPYGRLTQLTGQAVSMFGTDSRWGHQFDSREIAGLIVNRLPATPKVTDLARCYVSMNERIAAAGGDASISTLAKHGLEQALLLQLKQLAAG